jgi:hypothetical protein
MNNTRSSSNADELYDFSLGSFKIARDITGTATLHNETLYLPS